MAPRVQVLGPDGMRIFPAYNDSRELVQEYEDGAVAIGDEVIYRSNICEVLYEFTDVDGVKQMELLVKGGLSSNIQFQIM
ncbi:MAG: hypothetical protein J6Q02_10710 [Lachnospiraceae bacterium]|nr:hypothetical protein [Lachnospiraceae bacterium]